MLEKCSSIIFLCKFTFVAMSCLFSFELDLSLAGMYVHLTVCVWGDRKIKEEYETKVGLTESEIWKKEIAVREKAEFEISESQVLCLGPEYGHRCVYIK